DVVGIAVFAAVFISERVVDVEEGVAFETDVDESGLHARQDVFHSPFVDIAYDALVLLTLNKKLDQPPVFEQRRARLAQTGVDDNLPFHEMSLLITPKIGRASCRERV